MQKIPGGYMFGMKLGLDLLQDDTGGHVGAPMPVAAMPAAQTRAAAGGMEPHLGQLFTCHRSNRSC